MKRCPACNTTYGDEQNFCLNDGTSLVSESSGAYAAGTPTENINYGGSNAPTQVMHATPTAQPTPPPPVQPQSYMPPVVRKRSPLPWILVGVIVIVGAVVGIILATRGPSGGSSSSDGTSTGGASWQTLNQGGFSVQLPGKPNEQTQTAATAVGPITVHMYTLEGTDEAYIVSYNDYPETAVKGVDPDQLLTNASKGATANIKGSVTSERSITLNGKPGKEVIGDASMPQEGTFIARIYFDSPRLYQMVYVRRKGAPVSANGQKFLDSFQLTGNK